VYFQEVEYTYNGSFNFTICYGLLVPVFHKNKNNVSRAIEMQF